MKIIEQIKRAIWTKYQTTTLWTVDAIPMYLDHVPQSVAYPIITIDYINSNNTMAMPELTSKPEGFDYVDARIQFSVFGNDRQNVQITDIQDRLEDIYHRQQLTLGSNCTFIAMISLNQGTKFYDEKQKIWHISNDYRVLAGK